MEKYIKKALADLNIVNSDFEATLLKISNTDYSDEIKLILRFCVKMMNCNNCSSDDEFNRFIDLQYRMINFMATTKGLKHYEE